VPARNVRRSINGSSRKQSASQARGDAGRGAAGLASQGTLLELPQCRLEQLAKILVPRPPRLFPPTPAQRRPALPRARGLPTFEGLSARWASYPRPSKERTCGFCGDLGRGISRGHGGGPSGP